MLGAGRAPTADREGWQLCLRHDKCMAKNGPIMIHVLHIYIATQSTASGAVGVIVATGHGCTWLVRRPELCAIATTVCAETHLLRPILLKRADMNDEFCAGLLQHFDGRLATVRLNLDENTRLKGMRHFVATEEHARHGQNSMAQHIAQGVIFLIKHKGGRIWYAHVLLHLDALLPRLEEEQGISIGRVRHADAVMLVAAAQAQASAGIRHIPL